MSGAARTVIALATATILAAAPAQAEVARPPVSGNHYPLQPPPAPAGDARSEVQDLLGQISDLDDSWEGLTPPQRQQRFKGLQDQVTIVQRDAQNLPPGQQLEVEGMLMSAIMRLLDIGRKVQASN